MKKVVLTLAAISTLGLLVLSGCDKQTNEEKIMSQIKDQQYAMNADERSMALTNAKQYYEKQWLISDNRRGQVTNCRPSDSNANGMVSCFGIIPAPGPTGYQPESKVYCGYRPELVGCSDQDTVK